MSLPKRALILAGALCVLGVVLRVLGVEWGLDVLILSTFVAVLASALMQRSAQHELATFRRNVTSRLHALSEGQGEIRSELTEHGKLQRTTLYYAKNGSAGLSDLAPALDGQGESGPASAGGRGIAGRSSTPEVTNLRARHSYEGFLRGPDRGTAVAGVLSPGALAALPDGVEFQPFFPYRAAEGLQSGPPVDMIVIDQASFHSTPWDRAVGPVGISLMKDLERALRAAVEQDVRIVILRDTSVPDIHTSALDGLPALRLPLSDLDASASSGAPASPVVAALARHLESRRAT